MYWLERLDSRSNKQFHSDEVARRDALTGRFFFIFVMTVGKQMFYIKIVNAWIQTADCSVGSDFLTVNLWKASY